ncbi:MAG: RIP metalloprotease RseP [Candidatus Margulisbacteria bacterium]|nr:RIP metalloprotease RseP [Candidatus Margulisiibacteriota bacterium]
MKGLLLNIVSFLVVFTFIALVHELGHFIWAKRAGIRVIEFGLGFGPRLWAREKNDTTFSLNLIPILAFVRIAGEGEDKEDLETPPDQKYQAKSAAQKFMAIVSGPAMNLLAAAVVLSFLFLIAGVPSGVSSEIGSVNKNSPAEKAGLRVGDRLVSINGKSFNKMEAAIAFIHQSRDRSLTLLIERGSKKMTIAAAPKFNERLKVSLLGFSPKPIYKKVNPLFALYYGVAQTGAMILTTLLVVWQLILGAVSLRDLAGPIGIAQITGRYAESGLVSLVYFAAFISVNVGVLNLLPLPALDGGRLVFILLEWLRKKPVDSKLEMAINQWGFAALLGLMAVVSFNDILRLFSKP